MTYAKIIAALALLVPACDETDQDGKKGGGYQGGSELAADFRLCASEESDQDVVNCARALLAEELTPRCGAQVPLPPKREKKRGGSGPCPLQCKPPPPVCGDGYIEGDEQCDPGCFYPPTFTCYANCVLKYDGPDISKEMGPICP